jgi:hypothetical protein
MTLVKGGGHEVTEILTLSLELIGSQYKVVILLAATLDGG